MPAFTATAPGKIILFGEHAVVYGRPAIAIPVSDVRARVVVTADPRAGPGSAVHIQAPGIHLDARLADLPPDHPLASAVQAVLEALAIPRPPACTLRITSTIPVAAGMGSGAAVTVALVRSLSAFLGRPLPDEQVSALAFEVEKLHHGTPSGIDNTVVTYAMPVYFQRRDPPERNRIETLRVPAPFTILIGDTGVSSPTSVAVGDVRKAWQSDPQRFNHLFDQAAEIVRVARRAIESGKPAALGPLMDQNHALLQEMGVSSPELDRLAESARGAGALGAKLSGGGRGGNMIALVADGDAGEVSQAMRDSGAVRVIVTRVVVGRGGAREHG